MRTTATLVALAAFLVVATATASSLSRAREDARRARTTLVFFENHPKLLYPPTPLRTRRVAWRTVRRAAAVWRSRSTLIARLSRPSIPHRRQWLCIHGYEAPWAGTDNATHDTYFGGLQMDREFMSDYGSDMLRRHHGQYANHWTPEEQMVVAERAFPTRGFRPWPRTARKCGLL